MKKVYFAGSIRGGRELAAFYEEMIARIERYAIVLTKHVGNLSLSPLEEGDQSAAIYAQDAAFLRECDLVIAECSLPSLGVGYELAFAEALGKPCFLFHTGGREKLSAMLTGNPYFTVFEYGEREEALKQIDSLFG